MFLQLREEVRTDLVDDLLRLGLGTAGEFDREQVHMIADAMIAQTEALALGHLDGRYTDVDAIVEVLTRFAVGVLGSAVAGPRATDGDRQGTTPVRVSSTKRSVRASSSRARRPRPGWT
jgi:hypothetical protein